MDGPVLPPVAGASLPETLEDAPERPSSRPRPSERAGEVFSDYAQEDGTLAVSALGDLLSAVDISTSPDTCMRVVTTVAGPNAGSMTRDQALAAVGMISTEPSLSRPQSQPSLSRPQSQPPPQSPSQPQPPLQPPQSPQQPQQQQQHQHQRLQQPLASLPSASSAAAAAAAALAAAAAAAAASSSPFRNEAYMPPPSAASVSAAAGPSANAILGGQGSLLGPGGESGGGLSSAGPSRPFRRILTKNRSYLETGALQLDEAVVQYMSKLEEHRRKCEIDGRYQEAKLASRRLADLRTAQVASLRQDLALNQARELEEVHAVYEEEAAKFYQLWDARMRDYGANVAKALEELRSSHTAALSCYVEELQRKKPLRARPSRDYLVQREMQDKLVKAKLYGRATKVKSMADELYQAELDATVASWEAESKLKIAKLQSKQQNEYEVLLQRGAKGRDELELKRLAETERRTLRFRNIVSELEQLHKLELAHLENFLDAQVLAGKATPLKDPGAFRRKREQLFSLSLS